MKAEFSAKAHQSNSEATPKFAACTWAKVFRWCREIVIGRRRVATNKRRPKANDERPKTND
jgi:hypothetical protein